MLHTVWQCCAAKWMCLNMNKVRLLCFVFFFLVFAQTGNTQQFFIGFEPDEENPLWTDFIRIGDSTAPQGAYAGLVHADQLFAINLNANVPKILSGKNQQWTIEAYFKSGQAQTNALLVLSLMRADSLVFYHSLNCDDFADEPDGWNKIRSSFLLPADQSHDLHLKAYVWNRAATEIRFDAIEITVKRATTPSFLPEISLMPEDNSLEYSVLNAGPFFQLQWQAQKKQLRLADSSGRPFGSKWVWLVSHGSGQSKAIQQTDAWAFKRKTKRKGITTFQFASQMDGIAARLYLSFSENGNQLNVRMETWARKKITIRQNSLILSFSDSLSAVSRRNGLLDTAHFQNEYYLQSGGAAFGSGKRSVLLHNSLHLSSSQLDSENKRLILNLDLASDHPLIHYPLMPDTTDYFVDLSAATYQKNQTISGNFDLFFGLKTKATPRLLYVPNGFDAAFVWSEHADWTDVRTQRATNFGREDIVQVSDAVGGFAGYGIPVTRSVFYANPDRVSNFEASNGLFGGLHSTLTTDTSFAQLMEQLFGLGHEICLHTPEQYSSKPAAMRKALKEMKQRFGSKSWIDHGYNNKAENNRENLCCDALNPHSPLYARKLWKTYGIRYLWNAWYEEINPWNSYAFDGHFVIPYPGFGDAFPVSIIGRHPSLPEALLWGTTGTLEAPNDAIWDYLFQPKRMEQLIQNRSVYIAHSYPAWVKTTKGYWYFDAEGKIVAMKGFNQALSVLKMLGEKRLILSTTVEHILDYYEGMRRIQITKISDHSLEMHNTSDKALKGLSFILSGNHIQIDGQEAPSQKPSGNETVVWFDVEAYQKLTLSWKP